MTARASKPNCGYCGRQLQVKELNVGVYWNKWWHNNLHWGCAQSFASAVLQGEPVKLDGKQEEDKDLLGVPMELTPAQSVQVG